MSEPVITEQGQGERLVAGPTTTVVRVAGAATEGRLSAVEMHLDGGWQGPPLHVHDRVDHLWWVVQGEVRLRVGDKTHDATAGTCLYVPSGVAHGFSTASGTGAVVLQVDSPVALDGYFSDLAAAFPTSAPPDLVAVGEIMRRHDTHPIDS